METFPVTYTEVPVFLKNGAQNIFFPCVAIIFGQPKKALVLNPDPESFADSYLDIWRNLGLEKTRRATHLFHKMFWPLRDLRAIDQSQSSYPHSKTLEQSRQSERPPESDFASDWPKPTLGYAAGLTRSHRRSTGGFWKYGSKICSWFWIKKQKVKWNQIWN